LFLSANALQQQNALLHSQLEDVNTQAAKIRQTANAAAESLVADSNESDTDTKIQQLREVIAFVRKEKEIVDLQLHLAQVDNTRLKSENERLTVSLDEARATLLKVRSRLAITKLSTHLSNLIHRSALRPPKHLCPLLSTPN
jgi:nucleoprotein TPR